MIDAKALYSTIFRAHSRKQEQARAQMLAVQRTTQHRLDMQQMGDVKASLQLKQQQLEVADWSFTDLDAETATDKLKVAALQNDAIVVRSDCFAPAKLSMVAFKQVLRQVLNMQLTKRELAALVK